MGSGRSQLVRRFASVLPVTLVLAGCLFPSLDELQGTGAATSKRDSGKDDPSDDPTEPGSTPPGTPPPSTPPPGAIDASTDAASNGAGLILCGSQTCQAATQFCCVSDSLSCMARGKEDDCDDLFDARAECDGKNDCPGAQLCCRETLSEVARCSSECEPGDTIFCHGDETCPSNMSCIIFLPDGAKGCG